MGWALNNKLHVPKTFSSILMFFFVETFFYTVKETCVGTMEDSRTSRISCFIGILFCWLGIGNFIISKEICAMDSDYTWLIRRSPSSSEANTMNEPLLLRNYSPGTVSNIAYTASYYSCSQPDLAGECTTGKVRSTLTNFYTADYMRNIKRNMLDQFQLPDHQRNVIKDLGILRRFRRGCRGGKRKVKRAIHQPEVSETHPVPDTFTISVIIGECQRTRIATRSTGVNHANLVDIKADIEWRRKIKTVTRSHRIMLLNATSLAKPNAHSQLVVDLLAVDADIGLVVETWLKPGKHSDAEFNIDGYTLFRQDRVRRKGGGVCAFIRDVLKPQVFHPSSTIVVKDCEYLWVRIAGDASVEHFYCVVYHPPRPIYDPHDLINQLILDTESITTTYPEAVVSILGDLNSLDHTRLETECGMTQVVRDITHGKKTLDKCLTTDPDLLTINVAKATVNTKHYALYVNCNMDANAKSGPMNSKTVAKFPDIREPYMSMLKEALNSYNWAAVYNVDDVDLGYDIFLQIILALIDRYIPFKRVTVRSSDPWFVTPLIKSLMRKRNDLLHRGHVEKANLVTEKLSKLIAEVRNNAFTKLKPGDSGWLWRQIRSRTNYDDSKKDMLAGLGFDSATLDKLNEHFSGIATDPDYSPETIRRIVSNAMGANQVVDMS